MAYLPPKGIYDFGSTILDLRERSPGVTINPATTFNSIHTQGIIKINDGYFAECTPPFLGKK